MERAATTAAPPRPAAGAVARHAASLLRAAGARDPVLAPAPEPAPALAWARSGAMALTGDADGPPRAGPAAVAVAMAGAAHAFAALCARRGRRLALDGPALLGERAAHAGLRRRGRISPGGATRLVRAADGWLAVTLARPDDVAALPAWLETPVAGDPWAALEAQLAGRAVAPLVERAALLGLPVAAVAPPPRAPTPPVRLERRGRPAPRVPGAPFRVLDCSALWAGPLCAALLGAAGGRVAKVESRSRPDGARFGPPGFFALLNADKASVLLDLDDAAGRGALARLVEAADVVVESARPRALRQLGIDAAAWIARRPGRTWVSITGYGRAGAAGMRVAFGDDAAAAGGLAVLAGDAADRPRICADAVADPLAGLHAAAAALAVHERGGGALVDVSLAGVAAAAAAIDPDGAWGRAQPIDPALVAPPRARAAPGAARPLGADTAAVLAAARRATARDDARKGPW